VPDNLAAVGIGRTKDRAAASCKPAKLRQTKTAPPPPPPAPQPK
jgi:hypothetical protein